MAIFNTEYKNVPYVIFWTFYVFETFCSLNINYRERKTLEWADPRVLLIGLIKEPVAPV